MTAGILTVAELTEYIKALLDGDPLLADVWVQGEVSNCRPATSGHWYWTLKDEDASLRCVMWKGLASAQDYLPADGGLFTLHGSVSVYPAQGQYQLYVDRCQPAGMGDLFLRFEALKAKLGAEGLFDPERRQPLPAFPRRIGVVTSIEAAALHDICHVIARRWPSAEVLVAHTAVQGDAAPEQIVLALGAIARAGVDVVIVARGGGSIEDLWAFNDEKVARAIADCPIPVISGVGHETDTTIADFVADRRAATPSAAAEIAVPDGRELAQTVDERRERMARVIRLQMDRSAREVDRLRHRLAMAAPERVLAEQRRTTEQLRGRLAQAMSARLRVARADLDGRRHRLAALGPAATLARGFASVSRRNDGRLVRSPDDVAAGDAIDVRVAEGRFGAVVEGQRGLFHEEGMS